MANQSSQQHQTKVVHLRLKTSTILQCYDVLEKIDKTPADDIEVPNAVRSALEKLTERLANNGTIDTYEDPDTAEEIYQRLIGIEPEESVPDPNEDIDPIDAAFNDLFSDDEDDTVSSKLSAEDVKEALNHTLGRDEAPIKPEVKERSENERNSDKTEEPKLDLTRPPWEEEGTLSFEELRQASPKDALIEAAYQGENIPMQFAISCIYSNIPMEMWGGEVAQRLVGELVPTVQLYLESTKGNLVDPDELSNEPNEENEDDEIDDTIRTDSPGG